MCRSVMENTHQKDRDRLKIRAFYLRLFITGGAPPLPELLTLVYLPRITGSLLEVNGSKVRADASAFLALHCVRSAGGLAEAVYASTDRVRAEEGARFEIFVGAERAVKGVLRRGDGGWRVECRGAAEAKVSATAAEVCVAGEGGEALVERVDLAAAGGRRRRRRFCSRLEEIPEESDGCYCSCCGGDEEEDAGWEMVGSDGGTTGVKDGLDGEDELLEVEMEGVRRVVDIGIWAMFLGVGLFISTTTYKGLRRKTPF